MTRALPLVLWVATPLACKGSTPPAVTANQPTVEDVPLFTGLGGHSRRVTTSSPEAQRYFDQGLAFLFAFNHDEAIRAFKKASALDPKCASAEWGVALANGPHINFAMLPPDRAKAAHEALARARALSGGASAVERALIAALEKRHHTPEPADRKPLDEAYAKAMGEVFAAYPDDADVGALYAEAMMDLRPWDLYAGDGKPQPGTEQIVSTLEGILAKAPNHPLANHLYIHAVEASPHPERAVAAADRLRTLTPGLGHLVHMPSHIDVRTGSWELAISSNRSAIDADTRYAAKRPQQGFYRVYMSHNRHMLTFAAMMTGRRALAIKSIREMVAEIPEDWRKANADIADGFLGMPFEVLMRFGEWEAILAEPEPSPLFPIARALRRYARGVAFAATGKLAEARVEQRALLDAKAKLGSDAAFGNNSAASLVAIAEHVLAGEILFRDGKQQEGIAELRLAAASEDQLRYDEPPDWIQPVRHALGAALVRAGMPKDAEAIYREDLGRLPHNVWSLHGLARSLRMQKKDAEAGDVEAKFLKARAGADIELTSSCMCLPGI
jgi:tetratricopeptide (TPR) repeat protein